MAKEGMGRQAPLCDTLPGEFYESHEYYMNLYSETDASRGGHTFLPEQNAVLFIRFPSKFQTSQK